MKICWGGLSVLPAHLSMDWSRLVDDGCGGCRVVDARDSDGALAVHDRSGWFTRPKGLPAIVHGKAAQLQGQGIELESHDCSLAAMERIIQKLVSVSSVVVFPLGHGFYSVAGSLEGNEANELVSNTSVVAEYLDLTDYIENPTLMIGNGVSLSSALVDENRWVIFGRRSLWRSILQSRGISSCAISPYWHDLLFAELGFNPAEAEELVGLCRDRQVVSILEREMYADEMECLVFPESSLPLIKKPYPHGNVQAVKYAHQFGLKGHPVSVIGCEFGYDYLFNIITLTSLPSSVREQFLGEAELVI